MNQFSIPITDEALPMFNKVVGLSCAAMIRGVNDALPRLDELSDRPTTGYALLVAAAIAFVGFCSALDIDPTDTFEAIADRIDQGEFDIDDAEVNAAFAAP